MKKNILILLTYLICHAISAQQAYNISFVHDGKTIHGTFKVPAGTKKFKTILIGAGSGANDRYGTLPMLGANVACLYPNLLNDTLKPYAELSDALQAAGYAVLIYDKIEYTYPSSLGAITFHKLWLPLESAINYVKTRPDVDTNNIILLGHSEGSAIIPLIAKDRKDIKALISVAGAKSSFDSLFTYQIVYITQTCGGNVAQAKAQADQVRAYFKMIRGNTWNGSTPALFGVPAAVWYDYVTALDPVPANYNACDLPTLFLGLEKDINVPLSELSLLKNEVNVTDDFWTVSSLIHYMTPNNNRHIARVVPDTIIHWLRSNGFHSGISTYHDLQRSISIYPNPAASEFTVSVNYPANDAGIIVISDMTGKVIAYERLREGMLQQTFRMDGMEAGVYSIRVESGGLTSNHKLVKP